VILSNGKYIHGDDILFPPSQKNITELPEKIREMEELMISKALMMHRGNYSAAAKQLGISRQTLYYKNKKNDS
jgi:transcriptional regulator with PAS, ATPase and Fis domain